MYRMGCRVRFLRMKVADVLEAYVAPTDRSMSYVSSMRSRMANRNCGTGGIALPRKILPCMCCGGVTPADGEHHRR